MQNVLRAVKFQSVSFVASIFPKYIPVSFLLPPLLLFLLLPSPPPLHTCILSSSSSFTSSFSSSSAYLYPFFLLFFYFFLLLLLHTCILSSSSSSSSSPAHTKTNLFSYLHTHAPPSRPPPSPYTHARKKDLSLPSLSDGTCSGPDLTRQWLCQASSGERERERAGWVAAVCWLLDVPATCPCISRTDLKNFFFIFLNCLVEWEWLLDTCCFGCPICMCFVFLYLHLFSACEHVSHGRAL